MNSCEKGKVGEREFAHILRINGFPHSRRGQQHAGGQDSPDVICTNLPNIHFEVKRVETGNPYVWLSQADRDCGDRRPVVAHRRNRQEWIAIMHMDDLLALLRAAQLAETLLTEAHAKYGPGGVNAI